MNLELAIIMGAAIFVLLVVIIFGKKIRGVSIAGKKVIEIDEGTAAKRLTPHQSCPHSPEVAIAMKAQRVLVERNAGLMGETLYEQMVLVENTIEIVVAELREVFLRLLKTKKGGKNGLIASLEYDHYQKCLTIIRHEARVLCKRYLNENHLAQKTEPEFENYIKLRTKAIIASVTELLNREYALKSPSREELYDANEAIEADIADMISGAIRQCRQISIAAQKEGEENERKISEAFGPFIMDR